MPCEEPDEICLLDRDCPVCPYCGHEDDEWWDGWNPTHEEAFRTCEECDRMFVATMITKFDSRKPRGEEDG